MVQKNAMGRVPPYTPPDEEAQGRWMAQALELAREAASIGEVPVGAVIAFEGEIIAEASNRREIDADPVAHAELLAIRAAARRLGRWRLWGCTLVVTLEPCPMCAGAIVNARVDGVVFGAADPRAGAAGSAVDLLNHPSLNHRPWVRAGLAGEESAALLRAFFLDRRGSSNV